MAKNRAVWWVVQAAVPLGIAALSFGSMPTRVDCPTRSPYRFAGTRWLLP